MASRPARLENPEYTNAVHQLNAINEEALQTPFESTNYHQALARYQNEALAFRDRFKVGLCVNFAWDPTQMTGERDSLSFSPLILDPPGLDSTLREFTNQIDDFLQTLPQVSIVSLLEESKAPECSICLTLFTVQGSQASSTNDKKENNHDSSILLLAENGQSQTDDIPIRLPCGHVFGKDCVRSWLSEFTNGILPSCPLCRTIIEGISDIPAVNENYYEHSTILISYSRGRVLTKVVSGDFTEDNDFSI